MEFTKTEPEKGDGILSSKIQPVPKTPSQVKSFNSRISKNVTPSQSKIPKRDAVNPSTPKKNPLPMKTFTRPILRPNTKPMDGKKASRSAMSLGLTKTTPRSHALTSSRSNMNTHRSSKSKEPTPRSQVSDQFSRAAERVAAKKNVLAFENLKEKLRNYQTEFMKKLDLVKSDLPPDEGEYKLIGLVKKNDGHFVTKAAQKFKVNCPQKNLEEFKKDMQEYAQNNVNQVLDTLEQLKNSSAKIGDAVKNQEYLNVIDDVKRKIKIDHLNHLTSILKQIESFEAYEKPTESPASELEAKVNKLLNEVDELRKNLEQSQKELSRIKKSDEDKGIMYKKELEDRDKKLIKKQLDFDELKKKFEILEKDSIKDKTTQRELQEKLNNKTAEIDDLKKKLKACAQTNVTQQHKNQEHEIQIMKLETDLKAALADVERRAQMDDSIGGMLGTSEYIKSLNYTLDQTTKHVDEIKALKVDLSASKKENERLQKEVLQLNKDAERNKEMEAKLIAYKDKIKQTDTENQNLRQTVRSIEDKFHAIENQASSARNFNEELSKLERSEAEKTQKIEILEMELTKAHFQNQNLQEKIVMNQKLLKVRCSLIESLQSKESTQKVHLEDLFAEVGERNNDIQMLKTELITKTEEFQNLFSTLSAKQLELTRQEHMIKLLQESNERAQTLRVRQEAKIGRLEEEVAQLKQTVSLYQEAVLPNNVLRKNLLMVEANRDGEGNDNLGYYVDERRRKRHIDINVKKYEK